MTAHSVFLPREFPWTEEPGGLQSMGSQRVGHDGVTNIRFLKCAHFPALFILNFAFSSVTEPVL